MAAHQAKKPAAGAKAKATKPKLAHKTASPPKKKPLSKARPPAKSRPLAKKAKPAAKTKVKPAPKLAPKSAAPAKAKPQVSKVQAPDKGNAAAKLPAKGKIEKPEATAAKLQTSAKQIARQIAKQQAAKLTAKQKQDLRKGEQKPEDVEARRTRLKNLIKLGKERGFLTYSEINDHLPDDLVDAEQIESIITTFSDMGIQVYDVAPDAETLLISENAPAVVPDEDAEEEAEAALSTVDPEFGRTTDPVRMYMREMGSVELLTREGEIEIAKRIEDGLKHMIQAISACPTTIAEILALAGKVAHDEMRIDELVDGLIDPNAKNEPVAELAEAVVVEEEEEEVGAGQARIAQQGVPESPRQDFGRTDEHPLLRAHRRTPVRRLARSGGRDAPPRAPHPAAVRDQEQHAAAALHQGVPRQRNQPALGRQRNHGAPSLQRPAGALSAGDHGKPAEAARPAGEDRHSAQGPQGHQQADVHGRGQSAPRQARNDRSQPAPGDIDRQKIHQPRAAVPRPDPGGQYRPDEGGGQVRIPPRLQVLDLRHLVDPPGNHPFDRRPGAHHSHPGAHDRDHQQDEPHLAPDPAGDRAGARSGDARAEDGNARGQDSQDPQDFEGADFDGNADRRRRRFAPGRFHRGRGHHGAGRGCSLRVLARRDQGRIGLAHAARSQGATHALRHRNEYRPHARRGGQAVRRHARTHPPDRGESAAEAAPSLALGAIAQLP